MTQHVWLILRSERIFMEYVRKAAVDTGLKQCAVTEKQQYLLNLAEAFR